MRLCIFSLQRKMSDVWLVGEAKKKVTTKYGRAIFDWWFIMVFVKNSYIVHCAHGYPRITSTPEQDGNFKSTDGREISLPNHYTEGCYTLCVVFQ